MLRKQNLYDSRESMRAIKHKNNTSRFKHTLSLLLQIAEVWENISVKYYHLIALILYDSLHYSLSI